ncbi:MAG TPA: SH3 domain-containing protein [Blastocatellia bacterium]|nr:SH3 domain-containing protein [Blastocatellia bacterium]
MLRQGSFRLSSSRFLCGQLFYFAVFAALLAGLSDSLLTARAQSRTKRARRVPGQRAVVIDNRLSALRAKPDVRAAITQRLSRGHLVGVIRPGRQWHQVYVTRHTRGWILAEAVARSGRADDAARLMKLIEETKDNYTRASLARFYVDEFRATPSAPRALLLLGKAAEAACPRLTRDARKRTANNGEPDPRVGAHLGRREYLLNYPGLDRWNRAGITFEYDAAGDKLTYAGEAYRELLRKYPRSEEMKTAKEKIEAADSGKRDVANKRF